MSASRPSALLLDALGTLVALEPPAPRLRRELVQRFGIDISDEQATSAIAAEIAYYRTHLDEGVDGVRLRALRERCAEVIRGALSSSMKIAGLSTLRIDELSTSELTDALLASIRFSAFDDARPAILAARARGMRVIVASNWDFSLHEVLEHLGLAAVLDGIVTSAEAGARKPASAVFERALALAGAGPAQAIHVGDSLEEDVAGARGIGIEPVFLCRDGRHPPAGTRMVRSLAELEHVL